MTLSVCCGKGHSPVFRFLLYYGRAYETQPAMNLLAHSYVKIGIPDQVRPEFCDHTEYVRLDQIALAEPLEPTPPLVYEDGLPCVRTTCKPCSGHPLPATSPSSNGR